MTKKNNLDFHDALVHEIRVLIEQEEIDVYLTPYKNVFNYSGNNKVLQFKGVTKCGLSSGVIQEMYYIFDLHQDVNNDNQEYTIQFSGPTVLNIICRELLIKDLKGYNKINNGIRIPHPETGDTRIKPGDKFF